MHFAGSQVESDPGMILLLGGSAAGRHSIRGTETHTSGSLCPATTIVEISATHLLISVRPGPGLQSV